MSWHPLYPARGKSCFTSSNLSQLPLIHRDLTNLSPELRPTARRNAAQLAQLSKRADFDPKKACEKWRPRDKEWGVISTLSHNVIFDPSIKNFDTEITDGVAILVDHSCRTLAAEPYEARGGGNGFEVNFKGIKGDAGTYDIRARVPSMGPAWGVKDATI